MKIHDVTRILLIALGLTLTVSAAWAQGERDASNEDAPEEPAWADRATWTTYLDAEHGFVIDLPPDVRLEPASGVWYAQIYGDDGEPRIPALSFSLLRDMSADEVLSRDFPEDAETDEVNLGPGTRGMRVTATYETEAAGRYREESYLAFGPQGVYVFRLWESLSFPPFAEVVESFTLVERVR